MIGTFFSAVLSSASAVEAEATPTVASSTIAEVFELSNGLRIVVEQDTRAPVTGVFLLFDVGSIDDPPGRAQLAHLTEHVAFRRTTHLRERDVWSRARRGAASLNAFTALTRTGYELEGLSEFTEEWLWMFSQMLFHNTATPEDVNLERKIVGRELIERGDFRRRMFDRILRALVPEGHPLHQLPDARKRGGAAHPRRRSVVLSTALSPESRRARGREPVAEVRYSSHGRASLRPRAPRSGQGRRAAPDRKLPVRSAGGHIGDSRRGRRGRRPARLARTMSPGPKGLFLLHLHAHLPDVRSPGDWAEDWYFEAVTQVYVPLLATVERWRRDRVQARLGMSISPPLALMMEDRALNHRCAARMRALEKLVSRRCPLGEVYEEAWRHLRQRLAEARELFEVAWRRRLVPEFVRLEEEGLLELATSALNHGYLPLLGSIGEGLVRAQVQAGLRRHRRIFGRSAAGFWIPECAYAHGLDRVLAASGVRILRSSTPIAVEGAPVRLVLEPVRHPGRRPWHFPRRPRSVPTPRVEPGDRLPGRFAIPRLLRRQHDVDRSFSSRRCRPSCRRTPARFEALPRHCARGSSRAKAPLSAPFRGRAISRRARRSFRREHGAPSRGLSVDRGQARDLGRAVRCRALRTLVVRRGLFLGPGHAAALLSSEPASRRCDRPDPIATDAPALRASSFLVGSRRSREHVAHACEPLDPRCDRGALATVSIRAPRRRRRVRSCHLERSRAGAGGGVGQRLAVSHHSGSFVDWVERRVKDHRRRFLAVQASRFVDGRDPSLEPDIDFRDFLMRLAPS
ncbi:MAG: hypothetical protein HC923_05460 [Myxococcales bacterium]|nr:hypothetical protein [Myxococcales bacterium]